MLSPAREKKTEQRVKKVYLTKIGKDFDWCLDLCFQLKGDICHVKRECVSTQRCLPYNLFMDFVTLKKRKLCLWIHYPTDHLLKGCLTHAHRKKTNREKETDYTFKHNYRLLPFFCNWTWKSSSAFVQISSLWRQSNKIVQMC